MHQIKVPSQRETVVSITNQSSGSSSDSTNHILPTLIQYLYVGGPQTEKRSMTTQDNVPKKTEESKMMDASHVACL